MLHEMRLIRPEIDRQRVRSNELIKKKLSINDARVFINTIDPFYVMLSHFNG